MLFKEAVSHCQIHAPIVVCEEKGKIYRAHNVDGNKVFKYHIDGEIIEDNSIIKCDYLVENEDKKSAYLIELKGKDLLHAIEQVENTNRFFSGLFKSNDYSVYLRIVYKSNTHAVNSPEYRRFKTKYSSALKIGTISLEENI